MDSHIIETLDRKIKQNLDVDIAGVFRHGVGLFTRHWGRFLAYALLSTLLTYAGIGVLGLIFYGLAEYTSEVLTFLFIPFAAIGMFLLFACIQAGYFTFLRNTINHDAPPFSGFWASFPHAQRYLGLLLLMVLGAVVLAFFFGTVQYFVMGESILHALDRPAMYVSQGYFNYIGMLIALFTEFWIIVVPLLAFALLTSIAFPLAATYGLGGRSALKYSILLLAKRLIPTIAILVPVLAVSYLLNVLIGFLFGNVVYFDPVLMRIIQGVGSVLIAGFGPSMYFALTIHIVGTTQSRFDDMIDELGVTPDGEQE